MLCGERPEIPAEIALGDPLSFEWCPNVIASAALASATPIGPPMQKGSKGSQTKEVAERISRQTFRAPPFRSTTPE
jgi:hypothetical protein